MYEITAYGQDWHESTAKPRSESDNGYLYLPRDWVGEPVLLLLTADNVHVVGHPMGCKANGIVAYHTRPSVYKKGTSAACHVYQDHVGETCIAIRNPTEWHVENYADPE